MTVLTDPLPVGFDVVDRLRAAATAADDMLMEDVVALLREAATVIEALRREVRIAGLAGAVAVGRAEVWRREH